MYKALYKFICLLLLYIRIAVDLWLSVRCPCGGGLLTDGVASRLTCSIIKRAYKKRIVISVFDVNRV